MPPTPPARPPSGSRPGSARPSSRPGSARPGSSPSAPSPGGNLQPPSGSKDSTKPPLRPQSAQKTGGAKGRPPSGSATSAARALSAQPGPRSKRPQAPGPKQHAEEVALAEKEETLLKRKFAGLHGAVDVEHDPLLSREDITYVLKLPEAARASSLRLEIVGRADDTVLSVAMSCQSDTQKASLPSLLRIGSLEKIQAEAESISKLRTVAGDYVPEIVNKYETRQRGILQLRLVGSRLCLPKHVEKFSEVGTLGRLFDTLAVVNSKDEELISRINNGLQIIDQAFKAIPARQGGHKFVVERANMLAHVPMLEACTLAHKHFGPDYIDGAQASGNPSEDVGSLMSDGIHTQDLIKLVSDACGRPQKPSHFFVDFYQRMQQAAAFWKLSCLWELAGTAVHPEKLLQDGRSRCWILGEGVNARPPEPRRTPANTDEIDDVGEEVHQLEETPSTLPPDAALAFRSSCTWLAQGIFVYTPMNSADDEFMLRKLITYLASTPENFVNLLPFGLPGEASSAVKWVWAFSRQVMHHLSEMVARETAVPGRTVERPDLQFLWAFLEVSLGMVIGSSTNRHPEKKRLALFAAIACASRLWAASGKQTEPKWFNDIKNKLRPFEGKLYDEGAAVASAYLQSFSCAEAWCACPITGELCTPLEDRLALEIADEKEEDAAEANASASSPCGQGRLYSISSNTPVNVKPTPPEEAREDQHPAEETIAEVPAVSRTVDTLSRAYGLLQQHRRLLITGGPGSGRSAVLRGLLAHASQEFMEEPSTEDPNATATSADLAATVDPSATGLGATAPSPSIGIGGGNSRGEDPFPAAPELPPAAGNCLPVRVSVAGLAALARAGSTELMQDYLGQQYGADQANILSWEKLETAPFPPRYAHQVVHWDDAIWVLGGLSTSSKLLQDVWVSRDLGLTWEEMPQPAWPARYAHQAVVFDNKIIIIAGLGDSDKRFRDAWETRDGIVWAELPVAKWQGRGGHRVIKMDLTMGVAPLKEHLVMLGGSANGNNPLHDAWASDNGGFSWTELEAPVWPARHSFAAAMFQDKLIVAGGVSEGGKHIQDAWVMTGNIWKPRDKKQGGSKGSVTSLDLGKCSHVRWEQTSKTTPVPWTAREGHSVMAFRGQLVIFGGINKDGEVQPDAWATMDGASWEQLPEIPWKRISNRYGHQVLIVNGQQFIIGGADHQNQFLDDIMVARRLLIALDNLDDLAAEETGVLNYMDRLLQAEQHHQVVMSAGPTGLDHLKSMHLPSWSFLELKTQPFSDADLDDFCNRRLSVLPADRAANIKEMFMDQQYIELARNPLFAVLLLHAFVHRGDKLCNRCDIYQSIFELCLQSLATAKSRETSEYRQYHALGLDAVAAELALEVQSHSAHVIKDRDISRLPPGEATDLLLRLGHEGKLVLFDKTADGLRFRNNSMQEFLAARQLWRRVNAGEGLPAWLSREGVGSESAVGCGRFFCTLAAESSSLVPSDFPELRDGLGCVLRNVCRVGDHTSVRTLLGIVPQRQPLLTTVDTAGLGLTALHLAACHGHFRVCKALLDLAPDPQALQFMADGNGLFPLHGASGAGHEGVVRTLLQMTDDKATLIMAPDKSEQCFTCLHHAARKGHHGILKAFLELAPSPGALNSAVDKCGNTALHLAAHKGHESALKVLLSRSLERGILTVTQNKHDRRTALHLAGESGQESVVRTLLHLAPERSTLLQMTDKYGQTALHVAAEKGHESTIKALLEATELERSALLFAREQLTGQTALHLAADSGHGRAITALINLAPDKMALARAVDKCGDTALHLAAEKGRAAAARALLELSADRGDLLMRKEGFAGQIPLHLACNMGHDSVVRVLLEFAPNGKQLLATADTAGGFTPLHLASEAGHGAVIQALLENAADRNAALSAVVPRWSNFTPLHLAAYRGHEESARKLLQFAPDKKSLLAMKDDRGMTPVELARKRGQKEVERLLEDASS